MAGTSRIVGGLAAPAEHKGGGVAGGEAVSIAIMAVIILSECRTGAPTARRNSVVPYDELLCGIPSTLPQGRRVAFSRG